MSIFGFGKKKEEQKQSYCCGGNCTSETIQAAEAEKKESGIKILGGGCAKCNALEVETEEALRELGMDATICGWYADAIFCDPEKGRRVFRKRLCQKV